MKLIMLLKNWKAKSRTKISLWFFAVSLLLLILVAPPTTAALSTQISQIPDDPQCRRADTGDPRGPSNPQIPYVISPRRTLLLTDKPQLRWNKVLGVKSYNVSLQKGDKILWQTKVSTNEVVYPGEPRLQRGIEYLLVVLADNGRSSQEEQAATQFRLLPLAEAQVVKTAIAQLNNQQVTDLVKAWESAYIYIGSDLKSEAIKTLEALVTSGIKETAVYRKLGDLYWREGITVLAEVNYRKAVKLATDVKDVAEIAQISETLGDLYVAIGDKKEAIGWLTQARSSHKTLGNTQRVKELNKQIQQL